jgi:RNA polymerase sigma factor (sigma-70 family)
MVKRRITSGYFDFYYKQKYNLLKKIANDLFKKFGKGYDENYLNDFLSIARTELLYSMIHFNITLGAFNTFLYHRVSGSIRHFIDSNIKQATRYETELRKEFINAEYNEPVGSGLIIEEMFDSLKEEEAEVLRLRYLSNMTLLEITEKTGFSTYSILNLQKKATEKLILKFGDKI